MPPEPEVVVVLRGDATATALDGADKELTGAPHPSADVMKKLGTAVTNLQARGFAYMPAP